MDDVSMCKNVSKTEQKPTDHVQSARKPAVFIKLPNSTWLKNSSVLVILCVALFAQKTVDALCPPRCICNDNSLNVACVDSGLDLVPILLNPELIQLNLTNNKITNLHLTLSFYNNLKILDLSSNRIQTLGSMNFESQRQLQQLNLSNNQIKNITRDSFKGLKQLQVLDLSHNRLTNIMSMAFNDLKSLIVFYLHNNNLISFEPDLFQHTENLKKIFLNNNQLLEVPSNIFVYTKQLEYLDLANNLIENVDDNSAITLPKLSYLNLNTNLISNISGFETFPLMQHLDLSDNNINLVPTQQLSKLTNLTVLNLSGNLIESVPSLAFRSLFQLSTLYLNNLNHLTEIDARAFVDNVNLESIYLDSNVKLKQLPTRIFHGNFHVKYVSIQDNQFEILQPDHFPLDQLKFLKISGDKYHCNCSLLWLWRLLNEQQNNSTKKQQMSSAAVSSVNDFYLDGVDVKCSSPIEYKDRALIDVRESDISCTNNLKIIFTILILLIFIVLILFSFVTYIKHYKCLPFENTASPNVNANLRHNIDISAPSSLIIGATGPSSGASFYDRRHHNVIQHPTVKSPWDISYQEQYNVSQQQNSTPIKQKAPHIVFV